MFSTTVLNSRTHLRLIFGTFCLMAAAIIALHDFFTQEARHLSHLSLSGQPHIEKIEEPNPAPSSEEASEEGPVDETLTVGRGDTLSAVLLRADLPSDQVQEVVDALKTVFNPKQLRPEHEIYLTYLPVHKGDVKREILTIYLRPQFGVEIEVKRDQTGAFVASKNTKPLKHDLKLALGHIEESLYMDAGKKGVPPRILHEMIQAFSYDVDFQRSLQTGDSYGLIYDMYSDPDSLQEESGDLLYAVLNLQGRKLEIFRFQGPNGVTGYYNEKGESIKKGLLRTPIDGARISSVFGHRKHPVLGYSKMHKGVDFAAPTGTPIMAAGDGTIVKIGRWGHYGNYICIKHNGEYSTAYAHLSRYSKGLKQGQRVRQGQIIGYVGATGRTTGPHLHYELIRFKQQINPSRIKMLPSSKLKGKELKAFQNHIQKIKARLTQPSQKSQVATSGMEEGVQEDA